MPQQQFSCKLISFHGFEISSNSWWKRWIRRLSKMFPWSSEALLSRSKRLMSRSPALWIRERYSDTKDQILWPRKGRDKEKQISGKSKEIVSVYRQIRDQTTRLFTEPIGLELKPREEGSIFYEKCLKQTSRKS